MPPIPVVSTAPAWARPLSSWRSRGFLWSLGGNHESHVSRARASIVVRRRLPDAESEMWTILQRPVRPIVRRVVPHDDAETRAAAGRLLRRLLRFVRTRWRPRDGLPGRQWLRVRSVLRLRMWARLPERRIRLFAVQLAQLGLQRISASDGIQNGSRMLLPERPMPAGMLSVSALWQGLLWPARPRLRRLQLLRLRTVG
jgi:hypothetical protein